MRIFIIAYVVSSYMLTKDKLWLWLPLIEYIWKISEYIGYRSPMMCDRDFEAFLSNWDTHSDTQSFCILYYTKNTQTYIDSRRIAVSGSLAIIRLSWCYVGIFRELPIISASSFAGYDQSELIEETKLTICFLVLGNVHSCDYLECQFLHFCPESRSQTIRPASHQD